MELLQKLDVILGNDNEARKGAEKDLTALKDADPIKYASYLSAFIFYDGAELSDAAKSLCCVLLRRALGTNISGGDKTLWMALNDQVRENMKVTLIAAMRNCTKKDIMHKLGNVLVEIQGGMYEF